MRPLADALVRFVNPTPEETYGGVFARHPWLAAVTLASLPAIGLLLVGMLP